MNAPPAAKHLLARPPSQLLSTQLKRYSIRSPTGTWTIERPSQQLSATLSYGVQEGGKALEIPRKTPKGLE
jgi:hypothetical protein